MILRMALIILLICGALGCLTLVILYEHEARGVQAPMAVVDTCRTRLVEAVRTLRTSRPTHAAALTQEQAVMAEIDALLLECP